MTTDKTHDWEIIAQRDPWFGVLSAPEFRSDKVDDDARRRFYATGDVDITALLEWFDADVGAHPSTGRALDFGCGLGRLTRAMARVVPHVSGYDISETMLALAGKDAPANVAFSPILPGGPFAWINSYIVFQHIPPEEGLKLLEAVLAQAEPGCFLSLQLTFWRDHAQPKTHLAARFNRWIRRHRNRQGDGAADQLIRMYDYDMSEVMRRLAAAGFMRVVTRHTDHGGHHGAWLIARREGPH